VRLTLGQLVQTGISATTRVKKNPKTQAKPQKLKPNKKFFGFGFWFLVLVLYPRLRTHTVSA
jgi:hypothetical protein